jgi:hypothetical protein
MSTPANLNKVRKERARVAKRVQADENATRFGRSKAQKEADRIVRGKAAKHLDGHKKDP